MRRAITILAVLLLGLGLSIARADKPQTKPADSSGFRLIAADLIYIPAPDAPKKAKHPKQGGNQSGRQGHKPSAQQEEIGVRDLFAVRRNGRGPENGFFNISGQPVAPQWQSSDPSVIRVVRHGFAWRFTIRGPGKTTLTATVGQWTDKATVEVVQVPVRLGATAPELVRDYKYPATKYTPERRRPAGLSRLPAGCALVHTEGCSNLLAKAFDREAANYGDGQYWEYQQWPRCVVVLDRNDQDDPYSVYAILTRPEWKPN